ncbi:MAG: glutamate synthase-related protein [Candidatus Aureabacteria bacterium]|nr:glutamate synthase-related protein [Candidatus Auribacterota bacterium]
MKSFLQPEFQIIRDEERCIHCEVCVRQCAFESHSYDPVDGRVTTEDLRCVGCQRCATLCPTHALVVAEHPREYRRNAYWTPRTIEEIYKQAETGGLLLSGMGSDMPHKLYWDNLLLDASQVTNPSIDPIREPMELKTFLGHKPRSIKISCRGGTPSLESVLAPQLELETPIMFSAMSYGAISYNTCLALAQAATQCGIFYNTGEGGLHRDLYRFGKNTIVQVASGRFGVHKDYLEAGAAIEIKIGQGAKPGIGGHLPGEKVDQAISETRMIPEGTDALSPAPHHDIYSIEDLAQLIAALKETTRYRKPIIVKVAAVHNIAAIASGVVRAGADIIAIDGFRGGTGAAPTRIRDNVGLPIALALAAVDSRLRQEGIRNEASIVAGGGIRNSADVVKAIALGADAVYIATAAMIAIGCHMCQRCYTGKCNWGIATQDPYLVRRINPEIATRRLVNLIRAWSLEIKEMLGGMGANAIESLRGNRLRLRGIGLSKEELDILGVKPAGESL